MKKVLKLQDHKHTAKHLEHKHTSYRGLFLILFVFGICLVVIQNTVTAADYLVTAKIAAPIPGSAAQITSPANGFNVNNPLIEVTGTCPVINPAILVQVNNNGQIAGTTNCDLLGTFRLNITLNNGDNILVPKVLTITNDYGLDGSAVTIKYIAPTTVVPTAPQAGTSASSTTEVVATTRSQGSAPYLIAKEPFIIYSPSKEFSWTIDIAGGTNPYTITIDWGDGKIETFTKKEAGKLTISHKFSKAKTYSVSVAITDVYGIKTIQSFAAITLISQKQESVMGAINNTGKINYMFNGKNLYAIYIFLVLLVMSFWYGARIEQQKLVLNNTPHKSRKRR